MSWKSNSCPFPVEFIQPPNGQPIPTQLSQEASTKVKTEDRTEAAKTKDLTRQYMTVWRMLKHVATILHASRFHPYLASLLGTAIVCWFWLSPDSSLLNESCTDLGKQFLQYSLASLHLFGPFWPEGHGLFCPTCPLPGNHRLGEAAGFRQSVHVIACHCMSVRSVSRTVENRLPSKANEWKWSGQKPNTSQRSEKLAYYIDYIVLGSSE